MQQFSQIKDDVADIKTKVNTVKDQNSKQISNLVDKKIEDLGKRLKGFINSKYSKQDTYYLLKPCWTRLLSYFALINDFQNVEYTGSIFLLKPIFWISGTQKPTKELGSILLQFSEIKDAVADINYKVNSVEDQNSKQISNLVEKKIKDLGKRLRFYFQ